MYDVHVYPKNSKVGSGSKTVDEGTAVKIGDEITWTILGDIPKVEEIDGYKIVDPLDSKLAHVSTKVELTDGTALTKDLDYTVVVDKHGTPEGDRVTVEFIGEGLKKLAQHNSAQVKITIVTKIVELGEIENQAVVYPNLPSFTITPGEPGGPVVTPTPITKFGSLGIQKVSAANTSTLLAGAKFKVYPTLADAKAGTNAIKIGDIDSWTTDATGKLTISGLRYSGWYEGAPVNEGDTGYQAYWLAEVEAPNGFELLAEPVKVVVDDDDVAVEYTIENAPDNGGFTLPMTGSVLSASLFYGSGALVLAGVVLLIVRSRRKASIEA
jgi:fimbrial isopeptide formation D2 family protein/LPXTG-motif cell wall-anchored protein